MAWSFTLFRRLFSKTSFNSFIFTLHWAVERFLEVNLDRISAAVSRLIYIYIYISFRLDPYAEYRPLASLLQTNLNFL
jgi:hypothetical protein